MAGLRTIGWFGLMLGLFALGIGILLATGSAFFAGDWWLAPMPWIDWGMRSLVVGLAVTAVFAILLVAIEPIGWLRLLAVPPALFMLVMWFFMLAVGLPMTGRPPYVRPDTLTYVVTLMYSAPITIVMAVPATLAIALPLLIARLRRPRVGPIAAH